VIRGIVEFALPEKVAREISVITIYGQYSWNRTAAREGCPWWSSAPPVVVRGRRINAVMCCQDDDFIDTTLESLQVDIINVWPSLGVLNHTGAHAGIGSLNIDKQGGVGHFTWLTCKGLCALIWFTLSFDMIAGVVGYVVLVDALFDCGAVDYSDCRDPGHLLQA
jgi:hypothetical protein